ncbi:hypothetical protein FHU29_003647 [Hoyosella altamirensis]|uniref:Uncharacterized protein n=1 Tax=Hoyosella altamirensis TaxID=616997 RepID=A0A839RSI8_9ACTN|nr:hypothetical protein [Hoyosella altamirensis]
MSILAGLKIAPNLRMRRAGLVAGSLAMGEASLVNVLECRIGGHMAPRTCMEKVSSVHATATGKALYSELSRAYIEEIESGCLSLGGRGVAECCHSSRCDD